jgi:hypothetical protein
MTPHGQIKPPYRHRLYFLLAHLAAQYNTFRKINAFTTLFLDHTKEHYKYLQKSQLN